MKSQRFVLILFFLFIFFVGKTQSLTIEQYKYGSIELLTPILTDSTNISGEKFNDKKLLSTRVDFEKMLQSGKTISVEDSGFVFFTAEKTTLHVFGFSLQSSCFQNGTLKIYGSDMAEIFANEKKIKDKKESDSVSSIEIKITLLNGINNFYIKCLTNDNQKKHQIKTIFTPENGDLPLLQIKNEQFYNIHAMLEGKHIRSASISPNGKYALINFSHRKEKNVDNYQQIIDIEKQKVILQDKSYLSSAAWMPKSNLLYFTRDGKKGKELITLNPQTLQETILDENIPFGHFIVCPDEKTLIFTFVEEGSKKESNFMQQILDPSDRQPNGRQRTYLSLYDIQTGTLQRLTFGYQSTYLQDVCPTNSSFIFSTSIRDYTKRPFSTSSLYQLNWQTMQIDTLLSNAPYFSSASYSPDGNQLLIMGGPDAFDAIGRNIGNEPISNSYDNQLFIFNISTKEIKPLTKYFNPSVVSAKWNYQNNLIYVLAENKDCRNLFSINPQTNAIEQIIVPEDYIKSFKISANNHFLLCFGQSASNPDRLYAVNLKKKTSTCLLDLAPEKLKNIVLGQTFDWNFVYSGDTIFGRYYLPPNFDSTKTYPLLVYYYGGTSPTARVLESSYSMHLYAAQGYVVYTLNPSGTTGFGQEFSARHVNAWGKRTADEIIFGVKRFCEEHSSFINKEKIGCFGASYGGFMTQYLQTQTDIFAAAVSHAGISALSSYWGEGYWGIGYCSIANADTYPWNNPEFYTQKSPLFLADKINTPLLLLHGTVDTNVPIGESIQMYNALKILGKTVEFIQVEGENHGIASYEKRIAWTNTIMAWFDKYLKNQPQWWNNLYPEKKY